MKVKFKKTHENAVIPKYAKPGDAAVDLVAVSKDWEKQYISYNLGIAIEVPEGYVGLIFPRSSISNYDLALSNAVGVIDSGFRGTLSARFKIVPNENHRILPRTYDIGDKVCQLIIVPYPQIDYEEVDELSDTERGTGGFGSSGK